MSYDLIFWQQPATESRSPRQIHEAIATGESGVGLEELPVESFIDRCLETFPAARREPNGNHEWIVLDPPDRPWSFQLEWSPVHVWATLRGDWPGDIANQLIDLAHEIDCPLYDPQTSERFG